MLAPLISRVRRAPLAAEEAGAAVEAPGRLPSPQSPSRPDRSASLGVAAEGAGAAEPDD
jgi:hypothetical protein